MEQQSASIRKTFKYKLLPTPEQARTLATVVWRCRELYNAGLEERKAAWEKCRVSVSFAMQSAQLPAIKEVRPEYRDTNARSRRCASGRSDRARSRSRLVCGAPGSRRPAPVRHRAGDAGGLAQDRHLGRILIARHACIAF
jgi:putative transposase